MRGILHRPLICESWEVLSPIVRFFLDVSSVPTSFPQSLSLFHRSSFVFVFRFLVILESVDLHVSLSLSTEGKYCSLSLLFILQYLSLFESEERIYFCLFRKCIPLMYNQIGWFRSLTKWNCRTLWWRIIEWNSRKWEPRRSWGWIEPGNQLNVRHGDSIRCTKWDSLSAVYLTKSDSCRFGKDWTSTSPSFLSRLSLPLSLCNSIEKNHFHRCMSRSLSFCSLYSTVSFILSHFSRNRVLNQFCIHLLMI